MQFFLSHEDGYYALTKAGTIALIALVAVLILVTALIKAKSDSPKKSIFSTRQLAFAGLSLALAFALSYVKLFPMPFGGSVTLCSMLFVALVGYFYGPKIGFIAAFSYSILQFLQDGTTYILSPMQAILDYFLAFTMLGVSGFFARKKNGLIVGFIIGAIARATVHTIGGYIYWMEYMPEEFPQALAPVYPICYNFGFIVVEMIITVVILLLPPVKKGIAYIKRMALGEV